MNRKKEPLSYREEDIDEVLVILRKVKLSVIVSMIMELWIVVLRMISRAERKN